MYKSDGSGTKNVVEEIKRDLKKYLNRDVSSFELKDPRYLGEVSRTNKTFTCALIMTVSAFGKSVPLYSLTSLVLVRHRILIVYFYGKIEADTDLDAFNLEMQKVVDGILAANPVTELRLTRAH